MAHVNFSKQFGLAKIHLRDMRKTLGSAGRGLLAGAAGAALFLSNVGRSVRDTAVRFKDQPFSQKKKSEEVYDVKKSTVIALMVALAAVAGVLGALYFYVLRREKELDEYEQLLFSEDFNEDMLDPVDDLATDEA